MDRLTQEQQQLILDFYFHCGDPKDIDSGRDLIASIPQAAKLYAGLESALTDLDHVKYEVCPDNLVDLTIARLKLVAASSRKSNQRLQQLLQQEQIVTPALVNGSSQDSLDTNKPPIKSRFSRPLFELFAAAASIALVAGILFPSFGLARARYEKVACQNNMRVLGAGFASFAQDYSRDNNRLSQVLVEPGSPWWKIGDQGKQVRSNTRLPFILIKGGYVDGRAFVCEGDQSGKIFNNQPEIVAQLHDFPSHKNVSYSFTLFRASNIDPLLSSRNVIAGDLNPVFQRIRCEKTIFQEMDEFVKLKLNEQLRQSMSANHRGQGQNLLYGDGSVEYTTSRILNDDDIFTVKGVESYTGREAPTLKNDIFLAP